MTRKLNLVEHLSSEELRESYQRSKDAVERTRFHALWRVSLGEPASQIGPMLGLHPQSVRDFVASYNAEGPAAMRDKRHEHLGGRRPYLEQPSLDELHRVLLERHPDGGLWNGTKVTRWLEEKLGHPVAKNLGWRYLKRLNFSTQAPRPQSDKADPAAQAAFKK